VVFIPRHPLLWATHTTAPASTNPSFTTTSYPSCVQWSTLEQRTQLLRRVVPKMQPANFRRQFHSSHLPFPPRYYTRPRLSTTTCPVPLIECLRCKYCYTSTMGVPITIFRMLMFGCTIWLLFLFSRVCGVAFAIASPYAIPP